MRSDPTVAAGVILAAAAAALNFVVLGLAVIILNVGSVAALLAWLAVFMVAAAGVFKDNRLSLLVVWFVALLGGSSSGLIAVLVETAWIIPLLHPSLG